MMEADLADRVQHREQIGFLPFFWNESRSETKVPQCKFLLYVHSILALYRDVMHGISFLKSSVHIIFFCFYAERGDEGDSNLLPGDHEVLSGVFREEFGAANAENKAKYKEDLSNSIENYLVSTEAVTRDSDTEVSNMRRGRFAYLLYPIACFFSLQENLALADILPYV